MNQTSPAKKTKTVLLADDDDGLRRVLEFQLDEAGYRVLTASDGAAALQIFTKDEIDCVITDLQMPKLSGLDLLDRLKAVARETPVIVITAFGEVETAVAAMRAGAFDYITKPFNRDQILLNLERALSYGETVEENIRLRRLVNENFRLENVVGDSVKMREVLDLVERVSKTDITILITGESGTGKELVAKGIHFSGSRAAQPFIAVNCAAIPESLIESELFGHRRGAFTGASADAKGKFEEADGGTLFLDEISAMPLGLQTRLLRVLQEQEIVRLGESKSRKIDTRIITATNRNLDVMIEDGTFREDLYFRLAVVPINLPPLRERREDIPLLIEYFLERAKKKYKFENLKIEREVFAALSNYSFPGNVRELENLVKRTVVLSNGDRITAEDLPENVRQPRQNAGGVLFELPPDGVSLEEMEKEILRRALEMTGGNRTHAARYLNITRSALLYRMQKYGLAAEAQAANSSARGGKEI
ncbi:MAG: sigma-54 dependent transcriptional regulator [Acidobacteriota bacterium]|nr:sigma-54 dependent transcriptional regulator [Acidobacteriota bacterium]